LDTNRIYKHYILGFTDPSDDTTNCEFAKSSVPPGGKHDLQFNLLRAGCLEEGHYRVKLWLRADRKDFPNRNDFESPWLYFSLDGPISESQGNNIYINRLGIGSIRLNSNASELDQLSVLTKDETNMYAF